MTGRVAPCACSDRHTGISQAGLFDIADEPRHVLPRWQRQKEMGMPLYSAPLGGGGRGMGYTSPSQVHVGAGRGLRKTQTGNKPQSGSSLPWTPTHFQSLLPTGPRPQDVILNSLCPCLPRFIQVSCQCGRRKVGEALGAAEKAIAARGCLSRLIPPHPHPDVIWCGDYR